MDCYIKLTWVRAQQVGRKSLLSTNWISPDCFRSAEFQYSQTSSLFLIGNVINEPLNWLWVSLSILTDAKVKYFWWTQYKIPWAWPTCSTGVHKTKNHFVCEFCSFLHLIYGNHILNLNTCWPNIFNELMVDLAVYLRLRARFLYCVMCWCH